MHTVPNSKYPSKKPRDKRNEQETRARKDVTICHRIENEQVELYPTVKMILQAKMYC